MWPAGSANRRATSGDNHVHLALHQLSSEGGELLRSALRIARFQPQRLALHIAERTEALPKGLDAGIPVERTRTEPPDPVHCRRWLRLDGKQRHQDCKGEGGDEPASAAPHGRVLLHTCTHRG